MGRNGTGVRAASSSSIEITFSYQGELCRERIKKEPTPANMRKVALHRAAILHAIEQGVFDYAETFPDSPRRYKFTGAAGGQGLTVAAYLEPWVEVKRKQLKASTWVEYRNVVAHLLIPKLGAVMLADLRRGHVKDLLSALDVSNKRLKNLQSILRSALQDAVDDEILETNPLIGWTYQNREAVKEDDDVDPFTGEEQARILAGCDGQFRNFIQFALWTGLRTSELIGLNWGDIDFVAGELRISRVKTGQSSEFEVPKTRRSARAVKLLIGAREALLAQKAHTFLRGDEVFQDPRTGKRWGGPRTIRDKFWVRLLLKVGVRYRRPYQTRHTYASMMLSSGEAPQWVAAQLGHSSTVMISRVYGRWMPEAAPDAGNRADALFRRVS